MHGNMSWADKPEGFNAFLPVSERKDVDVLICPPFPFIAALSEKAEAFGVSIGAQFADPRAGGAYTGQVNAAMVKSAGAQYVIAGHSERRDMGEENADIKAQIISIIRQGLTPILCVGEPLETREAGQADDFVSAQLKASCPSDISDDVEIVVAYEPIWAIGTGKVPSLDDIQSMHSVIRSIMGAKHPILYGGSVKPANAKEILALDDVNGALVGGASLEMESFSQIVAAAL